MAYSLKSVYMEFHNEATELNQVISRLANEPTCISRDAHIEGCFIRLVVAWERFVEEYFLRCMCKAKLRSGQVLKPKVPPFKNTEEAFKKLSKKRVGREKDYTDWLDNVQISHRIDDYFRKNSRVRKICEAPHNLEELKVIRNAIAHRSKSSIAKFEKYVKSQLGYLAGLNPTMASLLIQKKKNTGKYIYTILSEYFLGLADRLTR